MTSTNDPSAHLEEQTTSEPPRHESQAMSIVENNDIGKGKLEDTESDYGDFANDAEELEIIDSLLSEAENWQPSDAASLLVTDIEDYEPPKGVRLPKILGVEQSSRLWEAPPGQILQDSSTPNCTSYLVRL
jgi:hypothetical protein